jgi:hypothetical protein
MDVFRRVSGENQIYLNIYDGSSWTNPLAAKSQVFTLTANWQRISITYTPRQASGSGILIYSIACLGVLGNPNLPAITVELWGAQIEEKPFATSYIPTTTVAVARAADVLYYKGDDGNLTYPKGSVGAEILVPTQTVGANSIASTLLSLNAAGATTNSINMYVSAAPSVRSLRYDIYSGGVAQSTISGSSFVLADGNQHRVYCTWKSGEAKEYSDTVLDGTTGTPTTFPSTQDRITIGSDATGATQFGGLINNVRIYDDVQYSLFPWIV